MPKEDGRQRPIGVASLEAKVVQGAVVTVLNAIYECDFLASCTDSAQDAANTMHWTR